MIFQDKKKSSKFTRRATRKVTGVQREGPLVSTTHTNYFYTTFAVRFNMKVLSFDIFNSEDLFVDFLLPWPESILMPSEVTSVIQKMAELQC
jgi:hypothetical protein